MSQRRAERWGELLLVSLCSFNVKEARQFIFFLNMKKIAEVADEKYKNTDMVQNKLHWKK